MRQKIQVKCLVALFVLAFSTMVQAETPVVEWIRQLGTSSDDYGWSVSVDASGNAYVTGRTEGSLDGNISAGGEDMFLTKYDTNGTKLWTEQLGSDDADYGRSVSVDVSGNVYVTGYTGGNLDGNLNMGGRDMFLTKYDTNGIKLWTELLDSASGSGTCVSVDGSGNIFVTGTTYGSLDGNTSAGRWDMFLAKYNTDGTKLWTKQLGSAGDDYGFGVSVDGSGNAYVTGRTPSSLDGNTSAGGEDMFLAKYNTDGTKLWTEQLGSTHYDSGLGVSVDGSGNAYVTGVTGGSLDGNPTVSGDDMFLTKYDTNGTKLWTEQRRSADLNCGLGLSVDGSGNVYVTGYDHDIDVDNRDIFLTKYDTNGTKLWTEQLGSTNHDEGFGVSVDSSGNVYVAGSTEGSLDCNPNAGGSDIFLIKISTVPEPGSIAMLVGIAFMALLCRRRKSV